MRKNSRETWFLAVAIRILKSQISKMSFTDFGSISDVFVTGHWESNLLYTFDGHTNQEVLDDTKEHLYLVETVRESLFVQWSEIGTRRWKLSRSVDDWLVYVLLFDSVDDETPSTRTNDSWLFTKRWYMLDVNWIIDTLLTTFFDTDDLCVSETWKHCVNVRTQQFYDVCTSARSSFSVQVTTIPLKIKLQTIVCESSSRKCFIWADTSIMMTFVDFGCSCAQ